MIRKLKVVFYLCIQVRYRNSQASFAERIYHFSLLEIYQLELSHKVMKLIFLSPAESYTFITYRNCS